jgi:hypothetical protein
MQGLMQAKPNKQTFGFKAFLIPPVKMQDDIKSAANIFVTSIH